MQIVDICRGGKVLRTFLVNKETASEALDTIQKLNIKNLADGEPIFTEADELLAGPVEFELDVMEV